MRVALLLLALLERLHSVSALTSNNGSLLLDNDRKVLSDKFHGGPCAPVQIAGPWDPNELATNDEITKFQLKGAWLGCLLEMTDEEAGNAWPDPLGRTPKSASSQWKGTLTTELATWAFKEASYGDTYGFVDGDNTISTALIALGLSPLPKSKGGDKQGYSIEHFDENAFDEEGDEIEYYD